MKSHYILAGLKEVLDLQSGKTEKRIIHEQKKKDKKIIDIIVAEAISKSKKL